ncbi:ArsR family transcriptional regulator [Candidatus Acidianus copahuensis]|uniref:ArsR family transcriptional regulator n=1 Tax=Candidatus Acidianus copahuensis TaxID=1160895 RepID=A0A031LM50_9CREN|nr:winged helix-turn-helix domain-containing protein [Candidatus Acidianus copahuensis]EZQ01963.1 ArsR family transcriptional regulator [Candidatus Acidianus copahuensis]
MSSNSFDELPCSAKLVYKILEFYGPMTFSQLRNQTKLPTRTLRQALRVLKENGMINAGICLEDIRSRIYSLTECIELAKDV